MHFSQMSQRLSFEQSIQRLRELGFVGDDEELRIPSRRPQPEDDPGGLSFFRTMLENADLRGMELPRTFFCRSEIVSVSFQNTNLTESHLCWNDFTDVVFSEAVLSGADLRASNYTRVRFDEADLRGADLRRAQFRDCEFGGADLRGAILTRAQGRGLALTQPQRSVIDWRDDDGPEPQGG
jgi:uncharacterized protein YjbI with pentapeptide repeats